MTDSHSQAVAHILRIHFNSKTNRFELPDIFFLCRFVLEAIWALG